MEKKRKIASTSCSSTSNGIDRISDLPDNLLHTILSSMSISEVVQLSVLSKRWKYVWTTMPYLHFDLDAFYSLPEEEDSYDLAMVEKFKNFINWVLDSQGSNKLVQFHLYCGKALDGADILRWINAVTRRNVKQLVLAIRLNEPFELPSCLATSETLQILKINLYTGILKLPDHHSGFSQLKLLRLAEAELSDQHLTSFLFSNCHLLENLILDDCSLGDSTLLVIASTSLIYLTLQITDFSNECYDNCVIKISCPNLKFLHIRAPVPKDIIIKDPFSIEDVGIFFTENWSDDKTAKLVHKMIEEVASTSVLRLGMTSIWGLYNAARQVRPSPISLYKLKTLTLDLGVEEEEFMQAMILLLKYSPTLEDLTLMSDMREGWSKNWKSHDPDENIVCLESHLKFIQLIDFNNEENEMELLRFFLKNAQALEKVTIFWGRYLDKSEEIPREEVFKFPRASSRAIVTFLDAKSETEYWDTILPPCISNYMGP